MRRSVPASWAVAVAALLTALGCASGVRDTSPVLGADVRSYLLSPLVVAGRMDATSSVLEEGFRRLLAGDGNAARSAAESVLAGDPEQRSASVLAAQADFVDGRLSAVRERVGAWAPEADDLPAAQLLLARVAELQGDALVAYRAYRRLESRAPIAAARAAELETEALDLAAEGVATSLAGERVDEAAARLGELESWAPESSAALVAGWRMAAARGDAELEIATLRRLRGRSTLDDDLEARWAELEVELGDAQIGLRVLEELAAAAPGDPLRAERLARARFQWRLLLLPEEIFAMTRETELSRAHYASLLYWLLPGLRGSAAGGRIAADILDVDPERRQEVARVVNRGVMDVDPVRRRFEPARALHRDEALAALLRVLAIATPRPACVETLARNAVPSSEAICAAAAACSLLTPSDACLPSTNVAGAEAQELIRRALAALPEN